MIFTVISSHKWCPFVLLRHMRGYLNDELVFSDAIFLHQKYNCTFTSQCLPVKQITFHGCSHEGAMIEIQVVIDLATTLLLVVIAYRNRWATQITCSYNALPPGVRLMYYSHITHQCTCGPRHRLCAAYTTIRVTPPLSHRPIRQRLQSRTSFLVLSSHI